jgi:hypothetical protein
MLLALRDCEFALPHLVLERTSKEKLEMRPDHDTLLFSQAVELLDQE